MAFIIVRNKGKEKETLRLDLSGRVIDNAKTDKIIRLLHINSLHALYLYNSLISLDNLLRITSAINANTSLTHLDFRFKPSSVTKHYQDLLTISRTDVKVDAWKSDNATQKEMKPAISENDFSLAEQVAVATIQEQLHHVDSKFYEVSAAELAALPCDIKVNYFAKLIDVTNEHTTPASLKELDMSIGRGAFSVFPPIANTAEQISSTKLMTNYGQVASPEEVTNRAFRYLKESKILGESIEEDDVSFSEGNGTTQLYNETVRKIFGEHAKGCLGNNILLVPIPSYGFFIQSVLSENGAEIIPIPLTKENNWKLTPTALSDMIKKINDALFKRHIKGMTHAYQTFLHEIQRPTFRRKAINIKKFPNNDLDQCKSREELEKKLATIQKIYDEEIENGTLHNNALSYLSGSSEFPALPSIPRVLALSFINPHNPTGAVYSQQDINALNKVRGTMFIIEDIVHHGINMRHDLQQGSFWATPEKPHHLCMLYGPSKSLCAAGFRVGMAFYTNEFNTYLEEEPWKLNANSLPSRMIHSNLSVPTNNRLAQYAAYDPEKSVERKKYIARNNKEYRFRLNLMIVLIDGIGSKSVSMYAKRKVLRYLIKHFPEEQLTELTNGVNGVSSLLKPDASFFLLLDFSQWQNKYFGSRKLETGAHFFTLLKAACNVSSISSEGMGYSEKPILRVAVSVGKLDFLEDGRNRIIEMAMRLQMISRLLIDKPRKGLENGRKEKVDSYQPVQTVSLYSRFLNGIIQGPAKNEKTALRIKIENNPSTSSKKTDKPRACLMSFIS